MTETQSERRYELKIAADSQWLARARTWINLHPEGFVRAYPPRTVNNLYLDTPQLNSFNANLEGVSSRQKLRLRWYGSVDPKHPLVVNPVLELKYKENMVGSKLRAQLTCTLDLARPFRQLLSSVWASVDADWQDWLRAASQPTLLNQYRREYYVTVDGAIRATLDYSQVGFDQRLCARPNLTRRSPMSDRIVIELKSLPEHAETERLHAAMGYFPAQRGRNSKYVNGVSAGVV